MSEIFADLGKPTVEAVPISGAVDIRAIQPARPQAKLPPKDDLAPAVKGADKTKLAGDKAKASAEKAKPKKPAPPAHPSRIWVQVGVGRDKAAIAFDWKRYSKQAPALFKGRTAWVSDMGRTNRILAGPFETMRAANDFVSALRKAGFDGAMPWTSPAGQVVDALGAD